MRGVVWRIAPVALAALALAQSAAAQTAPQGIDVSHWQGQIGWLQVGAAGYDFAFAKATEGTTYTDPTYGTNRTGAGAAGLRFGGYHFARPSAGSDAAAVASGIAQAEAFLAYAQPRKGDLLPVLDMEKNGGLTVPRLVQWTQSWLDHVYARTGVRPLIYASPSFWKTSLGDTPVFATSGNRLWIAHWTKASLPLLPAGGWGGQGWTFWQWTDCSKVLGISGCVDGDRLNGSSLTPATIGTLPAGLPASASAPTVVGPPQTGKLLTATAGTWSGGKPVTFTFAWSRCDAAGVGCVPIAGATKVSYTPGPADVGHALVVTVTAQTTSGTAGATSAPTLAIAGAGGATAPKSTSPPKLAGTAQVGQTLTGSAGTWTGSPTAYAYQWRRCAADGTCATIAGASGTTYTLTPDDIGSIVLLVVTATGAGGSASQSSSPTATVTAAPLPAPAVGSAVAQPGQAGAVTTADRAVTVTWQPGAVPPLSSVGIAASPSRLSLPGSAFTLALSATPPLRWPVDLQYAAAPATAVPGFIPAAGGGVWQAVSTLPTAALPTAQELGAYRDTAGALHVLLRRGGRIALFAPGAWGDPRFASRTRPRLTLVNHVLAGRPVDGAVLLRTRFTLDAQARLVVTVVSPGGRRVALLAKGSRIGAWLKGGATNTLRTVQLRPGALPLRIRVRAKGLRPGAAYRLRIEATDPYRRRATLTTALPKIG
jgi:GH25 family lysozyme M1 (1,4-beta-N-acetylmuramidase)